MANRAAQLWSKVSRRLQRTRNALLRTLLPRRLYDIDKTILVVGSGRSGTTWLMEMMNTHRDFRLVFEPFFKKQSKDIARIMPNKRYLSAGDTFEYGEEFVRILRGDIRTDWVDTIVSTNYFAKQQIVKEIRLNRMIGWVQRRLPDLRIIIIVRDPFSVAFSGAEHGWYPEPIDTYMPSASAKKYFTRLQLVTLAKARGAFQKNIAMWAIDNHMLLRHLSPSENVLGVFYEHLAHDTAEEMRRIMEFCGVKNREMNFKNTRKSTLASKQSVVDTQSKRFGARWEDKLTQQDKDYADDLINVFRFEKLYRKRNIPKNKNPLEKML